MTSLPRASKRLAENPWVVIASILAGVAFGHLAPGLAIKTGVIGEVYIDLLKMVVLPFMIAAVISSLRKIFQDNQHVTILPRMLAAFIGTFAITAVLGLLVSLLVGPGRHLSADNLLAMGKLIGSDGLGEARNSLALFGTDGITPSQSLGDLVRALIPTNIFTALTQGETLKVLAFSLLFGLAVGKSHGQGTETLTEVLNTVYQACLKLTHWFNRLLPLVIFTIIASQIAKTGLEPLAVMVKFILALGLGALSLVALAMWTLCLTSRKSWSEVLRCQREPMLLALATRSSYACMPAMITSLVEGLGFARSRIELLVPLGASLLRTGPALYYVTATVFLAQLYDVHLGVLQMAVIVLGAILTGFASSGMSGVITISLTGLLCSYLRLPFEAALALFIAVDPVCDMLRTLALVTVNGAFAAFTCGAPEADEASDPPPVQEGDGPDGAGAPLTALSPDRSGN